MCGKAAQITNVIPGIPGDINHDNKVSIGDLAIVAANYGSPDWQQVKQADVTGDGEINLDDLALVASKILQDDNILRKMEWYKTTITEQEHVHFIGKQKGALYDSQESTSIVTTISPSYFQMLHGFDILGKVDYFHLN
jgi:hypothetical protein